MLASKISLLSDGKDARPSSLKLSMGGFHFKYWFSVSWTSVSRVIFSSTSSSSVFQMDKCGIPNILFLFCLPDTIHLCPIIDKSSLVLHSTVFHRICLSKSHHLLLPCVRWVREWLKTYLHCGLRGFAPSPHMFPHNASVAHVCFYKNRKIVAKNWEQKNFIHSHQNHPATLSKFFSASHVLWGGWLLWFHS